MPAPIRPAATPLLSEFDSLPLPQYDTGGHTAPFLQVIFKKDKT